MSKRRLIGIDCDDVSLDAVSGLIGYNNRVHKTFHRRGELVNFSELETLWQCSVSEVRQRIAGFYLSKEHSELLPLAGAVAATELLGKTNDLVIITGRPESIRDLTTIVFRKHFKNFSGELHFVGNYDGSNYKTKTKGDVCKELGVNVFIEDAPKHAISVSNEGIPVLLINAPWNQGEMPSNITRVFSWNEILKILL